MADDHATHNAQVEASAQALDSLTTAAGDHPNPPLEHIHQPSAAAKTHSWIRKLIPESVQQSYESRYHMGNYVIDRKTGEKTFEDMSIYVRLGMHFLYYGYYQQRLLTSSRVEDVLKEQSVKMGETYDSPASKSHIVPFIDSFDLRASMADMVQPDPDSYATFNDFFSREIKPAARPVDEPTNDAVASSVADCRLTAFPTIDLATKYWIKGTGFTLEHLLQDAELARYFDGGSILIHRLAPQDYHRWHSPVTGTVESIRHIDGTYYTVNPQAINQEGPLDVFCENKRDVAVMNREATGSKVAVIAVSRSVIPPFPYPTLNPFRSKSTTFFPILSTPKLRLCCGDRSAPCSWAPSSGCPAWTSRVRR